MFQREKRLYTCTAINIHMHMMQYMTYETLRPAQNTQQACQHRGPPRSAAQPSAALPTPEPVPVPARICPAAERRQLGLWARLDCFAVASRAAAAPAARTFCRAARSGGRDRPRKPPLPVGGWAGGGKAPAACGLCERRARLVALHARPLLRLPARRLLGGLPVRQESHRLRREARQEVLGRF